MLTWRVFYSSLQSFTEYLLYFPHTYSSTTGWIIYIRWLCRMYSSLTFRLACECVYGEIWIHVCDVFLLKLERKVKTERWLLIKTVRVWITLEIAMRLCIFQIFFYFYIFPSMFISVFRIFSMSKKGSHICFYDAFTCTSFVLKEYFLI